MKEYSSDLIRNVVLMGHGGSGKTMLAEAMLYLTGATTRMGRTDEGTTLSDFDEEEIRRHISLYASILPIEFNGLKINVLDTPGFSDFIGEVREAVRVAEGAVIVVDSVAGVEVGTELVWNYANEYGLPRFIVVNKMDRDNASFERTLASIKQAFPDAHPVPLQLPIGEKGNFAGVIDLITMKARKGPKGDVADIPADLRDEATAAHQTVVEAAAEGDDELIMKYLEGEELTGDEVMFGLKKAVRSGTLVPVLVASGAANLGVIPLLETVSALVSSPVEAGPVQGVNPADGSPVEWPASDASPFAALIFKTTADPFVGKITYLRVYSGTLQSDSRVWNSRRNAEERVGQLHIPRGKEQNPIALLHTGDIGVVTKLGESLTGDTLCDRARQVALPPPTYPNPLFSVAIEPKTRADSAKISPTLTRLHEEDPTLHWHQENSTNQTILEGMGDQHIDVALRKAESRFGVGLTSSTPKVPFRETVTRTYESVYRHKKQTGGAGQFAEIKLRVEPNERGGGYEFANEVFGGAVSNSFMPSIEKGIKSVMEQGVIAGYPVVDVKCAVTDGKEHPVDSKPIAFEIAGREAFKQDVANAGPVLLEPIMKVTVTVPENYMGDVLSDLNTRRARVQGMDQQAGKSIVTALVPLAEMQRYATDLRSLTQGRGIYSMEPSHYEQVPGHIAEGIIAQHKREVEAAG